MRCYGLIYLIDDHVFILCVGLIPQIICVDTNDELSYIWWPGGEDQCHIELLIGPCVLLVVLVGTCWAELTGHLEESDATAVAATAATGWESKVTTE
jgi:hypothetical protein